MPSENVVDEEAIAVESIFAGSGALATRDCGREVGAEESALMGAVEEWLLPGRDTGIDC